MEKQEASGSIKRPTISVVLPAFNEEAIIEKNLSRTCDYLDSSSRNFSWELIVVNDGSFDRTGEIADAFAKDKSNVKVIHHQVNLQIGQALRTAFSHCTGDYIITMDIDLSYSPDHIEHLLTKIQETKAQIVIASPYMKGGKVSNVPFIRRFFSRWGNRFLSYFAKGGLHTLTSLVRIYDGKFLRSLNLKAMDVEINAEILYKAMVLRARIVEIPGHLDWGVFKKAGKSRVSTVRIMRSIVTYILSGFTFRPFMFFTLPGLLIFLLSLYPLTWAFIHTKVEFGRVAPHVQFFYNRLSAAVGQAFKAYPHTFVVAGIALIIAIQLISLGLLAYQKKKYFEDLYHLGTSIFTNINRK